MGTSNGFTVRHFANREMHLASRYLYELVSSGAVERVGEFTLGGIRDFRVTDHLKLGLGALYAFDFVPSLVPSYGSDPHGAMVFVRAVAD